MLRRRLTSTAIIGLALMLLSCTRSHPEGKEILVVSSRLWSAYEEQNFIASEILPAFEEANDCRVALSDFDDNALLQRAEHEETAKEAKTDVVVVYVARMKEWVDKGYLLDLSPHRELWEGRTFLGGLTKFTSFSGKTYFLPVGADVYLLCANRRAVPYLPAGSDVQNLTWEQLAAWAQAAARGAGKGKLALTCAPQKMFIYQFGCLALAHGASFPDLASTKAINAWRILLGLKDSFCPAIRTYDTVIPPMKREEAWITISHCARVGELYSWRPERFVIAPVPKGPAGRGSIAGFSGFAVRRNAPHKDLALKFLEYMTRPDVQLKIAEGTGGFIPPVRESLSLLGDSPADQVIRASIDVLDHGVLAFVPPCSSWGEVKLQFDNAFYQMVLRGGKINAVGLARAQQQIDRLLAE
ncbi:ABC transporter substrate-binding protein [Planctomycetota bacterium]